MDPLEVMAEVKMAAAEWTQGVYDPFHHNCNCFSNALALQLLGTPIPAYINAFESCSWLYGCVLACTMGEVVTYPEVPDDDFPSIANLVNFDGALLDAALVQKQHGAVLFKDGQWRDALAAYKKGYKYLEAYNGDPEVAFGSAVGAATEAHSVAEAMELNGGSQLSKIFEEKRKNLSQLSTQLSGDDNGAGASQVSTQVEEEPAPRTPVAAAAGEETGEQQDDSAVGMVVVSDLRTIMQVNCAACLLKLEDPKSAVAACTIALSHAPRHAKALYRRGVAYAQMGRLENAVMDLEAGLRVLPGDAAMKRELKSVKQKIDRELIAEKMMCTKMFNG